MLNAARSASLANANFRPSPQSVAGSVLGAVKIPIEKLGTFAAASVMIFCWSAVRASHLAWFITSDGRERPQVDVGVMYLATS